VPLIDARQCDAVHQIMTTLTTRKERGLWKGEEQLQTTNWLAAQSTTFHFSMRRISYAQKLRRACDLDHLLRHCKTLPMFIRAAIKMASEKRYLVPPAAVPFWVTVSSLLRVVYFSLRIIESRGTA